MTPDQIYLTNRPLDKRDSATVFAAIATANGTMYAYKSAEEESYELSLAVDMEENLWYEALEHGLFLPTDYVQYGEDYYVLSPLLPNCEDVTTRVQDTPNNSGMLSKEFVRFVKDSCSAIAFCHNSLGIAHRDLDQLTNYLYSVDYGRYFLMDLNEAGPIEEEDESWYLWETNQYFNALASLLLGNNSRFKKCRDEQGILKLLGKTYGEEIRLILNAFLEGDITFSELPTLLEPFA